MSAASGAPVAPLPDPVTAVPAVPDGSPASPVLPPIGPAAGAIDAVGRFVFRYRDYLAPAGLLVLLLTSRPTPLFGSGRADFGLDALGLLIAATGQAIRMSVIGLAYIQRGGKKKNLSAPVLVARGIYAHSRNPMYLGNFLLLTGLAVIYHSPMVYLVILPMYFAGLLAIVKSEERFLRGKFGPEYDDYCARVPRFVPTLSGLGATLSSMRFDWRRVLRKEYGTTFAWISIALLLLGWEAVLWNPADQARSTVALLASVWGVVLGLYLLVRWLKKSKRLWSPGDL